MAITKVIRSLPTPPTRSDPENFDQRADEFLGELPGWGNDLNDFASQANQLAGEVNSMRNATYDYMIQAQNAKSYCMTAAANANYKGVWNSSTSYSVGDAVAYNGYIWISNYDNNVGHTPGTDNYWTWLNPLLNNSGQLTLPFSRTPILVNGQDMMGRTFYVDAVNGDDNNPGTEDAPFKTLKKAIDSVPVGGYGYIRLFSGQTYTIDEIIWVSHKTLRIASPDASNPAFIQPTFSVVGSEVWLNHIRLASSSVIFAGIRIVLPTNDTGYSLSYRFNSLVVCYYSDNAVLNGASFMLSQVDLNGDTGLVAMNTNSGGFLSLLLYSMTFNINDSSAFIANIANSTLSLAVTSVVFNDNTGNNLGWNDLILGITRDADGKPRNILSDIVL